MDLISVQKDGSTKEDIIKLNKCKSEKISTHIIQREKLNSFLTSLKQFNKDNQALVGKPACKRKINRSVEFELILSKLQFRFNFLITNRS
jgi:hypothetical protein